MPGAARTNNFMLGTATVMVGPQSELRDLTTDNSIGLVKNFSLTSEPGYVELTQGVKNTIVDSVMNTNPVRASMEVYEFTAKNLTYGLGLNGEAVVSNTTVSTTSAAITEGATTVEVASGDGVLFDTGDFIIVDNGDDQVIVRRINTITTDTITVDLAFPTDMPAGMTVRAVNLISVGSKAEQPYLAAKIVGRLSNNEAVVIEIPKLRVVRGFNLAFSTQDYGNMPIEFTLYDPVNTDPFYSDFSTRNCRIFKAT